MFGWRKLGRWKERYLLCTPPWDSYGAMFESIFLAVNLARIYGKIPIFFYPKRHYAPHLKFRGMLNRELAKIVVEGKTISGDTLFQRLVAIWLDFNRILRKKHIIGSINHFFGRMMPKKMRGVLREAKLSPNLQHGFIVPYYVGYCGRESSRDLSRLLGIKETVNWGEVYKNAVPLDLTDDQKIAGKKIQAEMGMKDDDPFVCLYVRDRGFDSMSTLSHQGLYNADITNFIPMISFLQSAGLHVVRVGDPTMVPLAEAGPKFIDYVHTEFYSELMDLYLYRNCAFWVGTMGGARYAPMAYGRPCVVVNGLYLEISGHCITGDDVFLAKHVYSKQMRRFMSLREQLDRIDELNENGPWSEYVPVENTPEELCTAVKEFYRSKFTGNFDWNCGLQSQYWDLKNKRVREVFYDESLGNWRAIANEQTAELRTHMSRQFLEDCWDTSDYLYKLTDHYNQHGSLQRFRSDETIC